MPEIKPRRGYSPEEAFSKSLRPYQTEAVLKTLQSWNKGSSSGVIEIPTGGGKSLVQAMLLIRLLKGTGQTGVILCLTHVETLIRQNVAELLGLWAEAPVSISCASLKSKDLRGQIIFASIQTFRNQLDQMEGRTVDYVFIDEAHLVPDASASQYRTVLDHLEEANNNQKVLGLTATPMRLKSGPIFGEDGFFDERIMAVLVSTLTKEGYLCNITNKVDEDVQIDTKGLRSQGGDFAKIELEKRASDAMPEIIDQLVLAIANRKKVLIFTCSIAHAENTASLLSEKGIPTDYTHSQRDKEARDKAYSDFRDGRIKALVNVDMLTTGVNIPDIDVICMLRPTKSECLYRQMVGRGMRIAEGKEDCLILDYAGNTERHGPVDEDCPKPVKKSEGEGEAPMRSCPFCGAVIHISLVVCPECKNILRVGDLPEELTSILSQGDLLTLSRGLARGEGVLFEVKSYRVEYPRKKWDNQLRRKVEIPKEILITYKTDKRVVRQLLRPEKTDYYAREDVATFLDDVFDTDENKGSFDLARRLIQERPPIKFFRAWENKTGYWTVRDVITLSEEKMKELSEKAG